MGILKNTMNRARGIKPAKKGEVVKPLPTRADGAVPDDNGILGYINDQDRLDDKDSRLAGVVAGGAVHSTHLPDICPRQVALLRKTKPNFIHTDGYVTSNDRLVWATGRAFEEHIRTQFIKAVGRHSVGGIFKCVCGHLSGGKDMLGNMAGEYSNKKCPKCGTHQNIYHELVVRTPEYNCTHGVDLPYFNAKGQTVVVEIKSIKVGTKGTKSTGGFHNLDAPQPPNLRQAFMYHRAGEILGADMADHVIILYACKSHTGPRLSPYKEFRVKVDAPKTIHMYKGNDALLHKGKIIGSIDKDGNVAKEYDCGDGFPKRECTKVDCATARSCQVAGLCFSLGEKL